MKTIFLKKRNVWENLDFRPEEPKESRWQNVMWYPGWDPRRVKKDISGKIRELKELMLVNNNNIVTFIY